MKPMRTQQIRYTIFAILQVRLWFSRFFSSFFRRSLLALLFFRLSAAVIAIFGRVKARFQVSDFLKRLCVIEKVRELLVGLG